MAVFWGGIASVCIFSVKAPFGVRLIDGSWWLTDACRPVDDSRRSTTVLDAGALTVVVCLLKATAVG